MRPHAAGGHDLDLFGVGGELFRHTLDHAVHLAGEAETDDQISASSQEYKVTVRLE
jgi:hypothetical protein